MSTDLNRQALLGLQAFEPPERLRGHSRFKNALEYRAFLEDSHRNPEPFWGQQARDLSWGAAPTGVGGPGGWFVDGAFNPCRQCLERWLERSPDQEAVAVVHGQELRSWTRRELAARVNRLSGWLRSAGLQTGQRVLVGLPQDLDLVAALLACLRLGLVVVACDPSMDPKRLARRSADAACRALVTGPGFGEGSAVLAESRTAIRLDLLPGWENAHPAEPLAPAELPASHPAFMVADSAGRLFTLPAAGFLIQAISAYRYLLDGQGDQGPDRHWILTPGHHTSFLAAVLGALASGGSVLLCPAEELPDVAAFLEAFQRGRPRVVLARIKDLVKLVGSGPIDTVRPGAPGPDLLVVEGEALEPGLYHRLRSWVFDGLTQVVQVLSRPESGGFIAGPHPAITPVRPASVGLPAPGVDLGVFGERGEELPVNRGGLIGLRRGIPGLALEFDQAGFPLPLGIQARRDRDGLLWTMGEVLVDRQEEGDLEMPEMEALIAAVEGVEQVAVVRYRDARGTPRTRAFVRLSGGPETLSRVREQLQARLGSKGVPDVFQVVKDLPITRTGKLLRSVLKRIANGELEGLLEMGAAADPKVVQQLILDRDQKH